ncbi:MAG: sigma-54-dependent Fis family transcriptional regulator [Deltaproteobacteria bacterium]|nr:sigma-54-dependent Fis family transcriptional regulator [Deltaproteobacteria bacterium]MBW2072840.1 sigma-54-dependent Fis family transcriptional regulator [Deltaproteobacteria bacterium]
MDICDQLLVGSSSAIKHIREIVRQVSETDLNVLICGESGVGKQVVAETLHAMSHRSSQPFVRVNCAAIPGELLESELFGYDKGAFTNAYSTKIGKFEQAHRGTILLDEIGDMPLPMQAKMLQVLQDFRFSRLGGKKDIEVNCWLLASTNHDLERDIEEGLFREDLYYRLNTIRISIPSLRQRPEDIEHLTRHFVENFYLAGAGSGFEFTKEVMQFFLEYPWPGNVRELQNTVRRLLVLGDWENVKTELLRRKIQLEARTLAPSPGTGAAEQQEAPDNDRQYVPLKIVRRRAIQQTEKRVIRAALEDADWNRKKAARLLRISYKALLYKIKALELTPNSKDLEPNPDVS